MQQLQQQDWIQQQIKEKQLYQEQAKFDQTAFDQQTLHFNNILAQQETEHHARRTAMEKATTEYNLQQAKEKRDREAADHREAQFQGACDKDYTLNNDFMTENPATEQSMLAPHRVKPYHFKGFSAE